MLIKGIVNIEKSEIKLGRFINDRFSNFGLIKERIVKKVNLNDNLLRLSDDSSNESVYPMVDEFGLIPFDQFIFRTNWSEEFHVVYELDSESGFNKFPTK